MTYTFRRSLRDDEENEVVPEAEDAEDDEHHHHHELGSKCLLCNPDNNRL